MVLATPFLQPRENEQATARLAISTSEASRPPDSRAQSGHVFLLFTYFSLQLKNILIYFNWRIITILCWFLPYISMNRPQAYIKINDMIAEVDREEDCGQSYPGAKITWQKSGRGCIVCMRACSVSQLCPTLCGLMDCSPPGSSVHGILQARILEWDTISFSRGSSQSRD